MQNSDSLKTTVSDSANWTSDCRGGGSAPSDKSQPTEKQQERGGPRGGYNHGGASVEVPKCVSPTKPGPISGLMHFPEAQTGARQDGQLGPYIIDRKRVYKEKRSWITARPVFGTRPNDGHLDVSAQREMEI